MRKRQDRSAIGYVWAAIGLPFLLGMMAADVTVAHAQTTGLVAPMSGDCTTSATGAVVCTRTNGVALANSATTDTTNAANITTGTLPVAQVPALTGAKLPAGAPGTVTTYNAAGVQAPAIAAPYAGTAGPIKVAPFSVSAPTSAGTLIGPFNSSSYRVVSLTNGARLLTSGQVTQAKTYIASTTGATALYFELWRVNASGTFNLVCRSQNLLSGVSNNALNTFAITSTCNAQAGDYPAMLEVGSFSGQVTTFSASTAYTAAVYPTYYANGIVSPLNSTEDFVGGTAGTSYAAYYNVPIEVYEAKGPVLVGMGDSKMQGIPFSGDFLQAGYNGAYQFPVAPQTNYGTASLGTSLIDLSNQPIAWAARTLGYSYANLGLTGSTSTVQLAQVLPTALQLKPAVLVLSGTINDSSYAVPTGTSVANYTSMYNQAIAAGVQKVVMVGAEPAGYIPESTWANTNYGGDAMNAGLKSFCQAQTACVWIGDAVTAAVGQYRTGGAAGSMHNMQPAYAAADNLHFTNAGAQAVGVLEANAIEPPAVAGTAVAVGNPFGTATRSRVVVSVTHDGVLGWRWQDTRDFVMLDTQSLDGIPGSAGAGAQGQQAVGCVTFLAAKGYVRCDGSLVWNQQASALTAPTVNAANATIATLSATTGTVGTLKTTAPATMAVAAGNTGANIASMTSAEPTGAAGITGVQASGGNLYNIAVAFGGSLSGYGGTAGMFDGTLGKFPLQTTKDGRVCLLSGLTAGVTTYGGSTAGNGCPVSSGAILYPSGVLALNATTGALATAHVVGASAAPAVVAGAAAASCTVSGTDLGFLLTCTTGSAPAAGSLATVTFAGAYGSAPHFGAPAAVNAASAAVGSGLYAASTTTALTVSTANALAASTSYAWHFVLVQ